MKLLFKSLYVLFSIIVTLLINSCNEKNEFIQSIENEDFYKLVKDYYKFSSYEKDSIIMLISPENNISKNIIKQLSKANHFLNIANYDSLITTLDYLKYYSRENSVLSYELDYLRNKINLSKEEKLLNVEANIIKNIKILEHKKDKSHQYYYIKFLLQLAVLNNKLNKNYYSLSILNYAFSLVKEKNYNIPESILAQMHLNYGIILIQEEFSNAEIIKKHIEISLSIDTSNYYNCNSQALTIKNNFDKNVTLDDFTKVYNLANTKIHKIDALISKSDFVESISLDSSLLYIVKAKELAKEANLYNIYFETLFAEAFILFKLNHLKEYLKRKTELENYNNSKSISPQFKFYYYSFLIEKEVDKNLKINQLLSQRDAAKKIGEDIYLHHFSDYFAENACQIFDLLLSKNNESYDSYNLNLILDIYSDSNFRSLQKAKMNIQNESSEIDSKIDYLLSIINDFHNPEKGSLKLFEELVSLYELKYSTKQIKQEESNFIDYHQLKSKLTNSKEELLLTLSNDYYYYVIHVQNNNYKINKISIEDLKPLVDDYHNSIKANKNPSVENLSRLLLSNFRITKPNFRIFPDDILSTVPFEYLDYNNSKLLTQLKITYSYELNEIIENRPYYNSTSFSILSYSDSITLKSDEELTIHELPYGYQECKAIRKLLNLNSTQEVFGFSLNKTNTYSALKSNHIHIASHAHSNPLEWRNNYFYIRENKNPKEFYNSDIIQLNKTPNFVFLSACDTGIGNHKIGEGNFSLSRAFLEKGSKTVIHTLWKVDDFHAKNLTLEFYKLLKEGNSASESLHQAKLNFINKYPHVKELAYSFVLVGNGEYYLQ